MMAPLAETRRLGKTFGVTPVLREVDLAIFAGTATVVIGGNGAGKSTLLRILAGLSQPSAGCVLVFGKDSRKLAAHDRRRIGMLSHQSWLYPGLTARENLEFYARLYGIEAHATVAREWLERVGLGAVGDQRVRSFSRGMEQRLAIARAMLVSPALLLLDEPFASLDPEGVARVGRLISGQVAGGCAVMITAHSGVEIEGVEIACFELSRGRVQPRDKESRVTPLRARVH